MNTSLKTRHQELLAKKNELIARLQSIRQDFASGLEKDWEEQAVQLENVEVLNEIARISSEELSKIEIAIERIEAALRNQ